MKNKIIAMALAMFLAMPCVLFAEEIEIQLMEVIQMGTLPGDNPLDGPDHMEPTSPKNSPARKKASDTIIEEPQRTVFKLLRDGQLYIQSEGAIYNAEGIRIK